VTSGSIYTGHVTRPGLYQPPGFAVHLAAQIKAAVKLPVFAQGSIVDPAMAAALLADGQSRRGGNDPRLDRRPGTAAQTAPGPA
jgi:2,4-dienoyl-CoA reductase-like NADH-dependent reductase (Old Yellow Enzyme family)